MADQEEMVEVEDFELEQALSDEPEPKTEVKPEKDEADKAEPEQEPEKAEKPEPDESPSDSDSLVPRAGLIDERKKRQALEERNRELQTRLDDLSKPEKRPSVFDDEEGAFSTLEQNLSKARLADKFELSRDMMSMLKDDYIDRENEFMEMAQDNPELQRQLREHPNPARFAYEMAIKHKELKDMENLPETREKLKAQLREEIKAELLAEQEAKDKKESEKRESVTPSLAGQRSSGGNEETINENLTVDDILET